MANSSISYPPSNPIIDNTKVDVPSDTSIGYPVGIMIQHDGVDITDEFDTLDIIYETEEISKGSLNFGRSVKFEKNGVVLNTDEPSTINQVTNLNLSESPAGTLAVLDTDYQINNTPKQYGAKNLNFLGRKLMYDNGDGELLFNACGDGYFGDGSDGDVVISTDSSLSRDMYYENLTVNAGVTLTTMSWRIFVRGKLSLYGIIDNSAHSDIGAPSGYFPAAGSGGAGGVGGEPIQTHFPVIKMEQMAYHHLI